MAGLLLLKNPLMSRGILRFTQQWQVFSGHEKALTLQSGLLNLSGGTDGARTRDPLRDRQV
ncbi:MAG: hypothetical protein V4752_14580, partial [Pantoea dispersa]